jgi:hypothetical protein
MLGPVAALEVVKAELADPSIIPSRHGVEVVGTRLAVKPPGQLRT